MSCTNDASFKDPVPGSNTHTSAEAGESFQIHDAHDKEMGL